MLGQWGGGGGTRWVLVQYGTRRLIEFENRRRPSNRGDRAKRVVVIIAIIVGVSAGNSTSFDLTARCTRVFVVDDNNIVERRTLYRICASVRFAYKLLHTRRYITLRL